MIVALIKLTFGKSECLIIDNESGSNETDCGNLNVKL